MNPETQTPAPNSVNPNPIAPEVPTQTVAPVATPPVTAAPTMPATPAKKNKKWKIIGVIVLILAVLAVIGVKAASSITAAPAKVSDAFVTDLKTGDFDTAQTLESPTMKQAVSVDQVAAAWKDSGFPDTTYTAIDKLVQAQYGKQYASIVYKAAGVTDKVYLHVVLVKNDGIWQVLSFRTDSSSTAVIK